MNAPLLPIAGPAPAWYEAPRLVPPCVMDAVAVEFRLGAEMQIRAGYAEVHAHTKTGQVFVVYYEGFAQPAARWNGLYDQGPVFWRLTP